MSNWQRTLIVLRDICDVAIIVSGDQDYVPAVQRVKESWKRVINVSFKTRDGRLLRGGTRLLGHLIDRSFEFDYGDMKRFLGL